MEDWARVDVCAQEEPAKIPPIICSNGVADAHLLGRGTSKNRITEQKDDLVVTDLLGLKRLR